MLLEPLSNDNGVSLHGKPLVIAENLRAFPEPSPHTIYLLRRDFFCNALL